MKMRRKSPSPALIVLNLLLFLALAMGVFLLANLIKAHSQVLVSTSSDIGSLVFSALEESALPSQRENPSSGEKEEENAVSQAESIQTLLSQMSPQEKLGQLLVTAPPDQDACNALAAFQPAGLILFAKDFEGLTPDEVKRLLQDYKASVKIPLLVGTDEEGGEIVRISRYTAFRETPFPSPQKLANMGGLAEVRADTLDKSAFLLDLGLNWNLAPVADVSQNPKDYIYSRTYGKSAEETAAYVETVVEAMGEAGVASSLKHFPGYGNNVDTHKGIAMDNRPFETFMTNDFLPFMAGIQAGAESVLVSHTLVTSMDETLPASLSPKVHEILRTKLFFTGVILTDDLTMDAVKDYTGAESASVLALRAGNDLILNKDFAKAYKDLEDALSAGAITEKQIDEAVTRTLLWKAQLNLLD